MGGLTEGQKLEFAVTRIAVIAKARRAHRRRVLARPITGRWTVVNRGDGAWR